MDKKMKIHSAMCFTPKVLADYIRSQTDLSDKLDREILIILTFRKVLEKEYGYKDYCIYFPPKPGAEKELNEALNTKLEIAKAGEFIRKHVEEANPIDVVYVQPKEGEPADLMPYQLKQFGVWEDAKNDTDEFIKFLEDLKKYSPTETGLLIFMQQLQQVDLETVFEYFRNNSLPFREVIFFYLTKNRGVNFVQLEPNRGDKYGTCSYSMDEITSI